MNTQDNVYLKQPYIPYAPTNGGTRPYGRPVPVATADTAMLPIAIVGMCVTFMLGLPVGLFTGPAALKRANRLEHQVNIGRRPNADRGSITGARICAWVSIGLSIPLLLMWLGMFVIIAAAFSA